MMAGSPIAPVAVPTASLFLVPPRVDRVVLGRRLASPMLSDRPRDHALAERGVHPDLIELSPLSGKEKIGIDQVREAIRLAQYSPTQSDRKVCLIPFCERLTPEAANGLLKLVEEPPRGLVFALLAEHASELLPTLVSRSRLVRVASSGRRAAAEQLVAAGYSSEEAPWLAAVATREGELETLLASQVDVTARRAAARGALAEAPLLDTIAQTLDADPIERHEALVWVLDHAASRDADLLTSGVSHLAAQEKPVLLRFLEELLTVTFERIREQATTARKADLLPSSLAAVPSNRIERFARSIDRSYRAVMAHVPTDAVLLSLLLSLGGDPGAH
jgi:hypothetical protein